jgi:hypothetical protein
VDLRLINKIIISDITKFYFRRFWPCRLSFEFILLLPGFLFDRPPGHISNAADLFSRPAGKLFLNPRKTPRRLYALEIDDSVLNMDHATPNAQIVARYFQIKFAFQRLRVRHLDFGSPIGKLEDGARNPLSVVKYEVGRFEGGPLAEFRLIF